jgi:predicted ABC-type ATPase
MPTQHPRCIIVAGPNGAGKTTFAREFLPKEGHCPIFVNADLIASGLSPFQPEAAVIQAGRLFIEQIDTLAKEKKDFAFESTLSGTIYLRKIQQWKNMGYSIHIVFLKLPDANFAIRRVCQRVKSGGHSIPEATIRRRFLAGWRNFTEHYRQLANSWAIYDNSHAAPILLEESV